MLLSSPLFADPNDHILLLPQKVFNLFVSYLNMINIFELVRNGMTDTCFTDDDWSNSQVSVIESRRDSEPLRPLSPESTMTLVLSHSLILHIISDAIPAFN